MTSSNVLGGAPEKVLGIVGGRPPFLSTCALSSRDSHARASAGIAEIPNVSWEFTDPVFTMDLKSRGGSEMARPASWVVEWESPKLVRQFCPIHFDVGHGEPCPLSDLEPNDTCAFRGFPTRALAFSFAERVAADPQSAMVCVTERSVEEDEYAFGLWDVEDVRWWYWTGTAWEGE